jgi:uncharacterized protein YutE (UPF0331/DUF86 family)
MVDKELLSRKLSTLRSYVEELKRAEDITREKYESDRRAKAFVERYLHLAIEEVIDVANHIVSFHQWREPTGYRDLFTVLKEHGVIDGKDLALFQNMAAFRNMLVHRYEVVDDDLVFGAFKNRLADFERFITLITDWAKKEKDS